MYRRQFCETVTRQLRCRWEAPAIRQELSDHIQDHQAALMATGMDRDAAEEAAVASMGDPKELGRALDRVHSPWPWRLYHAVLTAAVLLSGLALCLGLSNLFGSTSGLPPKDPRVALAEQDPEYIMEQYVRSQGDAVIDTGTVTGGGDIGPYSLSPVGEALLIFRPGNGGDASTHLAFLVSSLHLQPWLGALVTDNLACTVVDDRGNTYDPGRISFLYTGNSPRDLCRVFLEEPDPDARQFTFTLASDRGSAAFTVTLEGGEAP